ncbi:hypothetical protein V6N13_044313 [Hibiscus sabdariffa]
MWKTGFFRLESHRVLDRAIVLLGSLASTNSKYGLVNIYAPNELTERVAFFDSLSDILRELQVPIIMGGDFNIIKSREEKPGLVVDKRAMGKFNKLIQANELVNLPMGGMFFTWARNKPNFTACLLDRFLVSPDILLWIPNLSQSALQRKLLDHCPVLLQEIQIGRKDRPFKWFSHWAEIAEFSAMMRNILTQSKPKGIGAKLREVNNATNEWVSLERAKDINSVEALENRISNLEQHLMSVGRAADKEVVVKNEIQELKSKI